MVSYLIMHEQGNNSNAVLILVVVEDDLVHKALFKYDLAA